MNTSTQKSPRIEFYVEYWGESMGLQKMRVPSEEHAQRACVEIIKGAWFDVNKISYLGWVMNTDGEVYHADRKFIDCIEPSEENFIGACKWQMKLPNGQAVKFFRHTQDFFKEGFTLSK